MPALPLKALAVAIALALPTAAAAAPKKPEPPKAIILLAGGISMATACHFSVNEAAAVAYIHLNLGDKDFTTEDVVTAMHTVQLNDIVSSYLGNSPDEAEMTRRCNNTLIMFGPNGSVIQGLLSK